MPEDIDNLRSRPESRGLPDADDAEPRWNYHVSTALRNGFNIRVRTQGICYATKTARPR